MNHTNNIIAFSKELTWDDLPFKVRDYTKLCLLDLLGVAASGARTKLSNIACGYAALDMSGTIPMIFDGRKASVAGVAMAGGMTIDSLDGHDGFNPAKGHAGCGLFQLYTQWLKIINQFQASSSF